MHCSILNPLDFAMIPPSRYGGLESVPVNIKTILLFKNLRTGRSKPIKKLLWVKNRKTSYLGNAHNNKRSMVSPIKLYHKALLRVCERGVFSSLTPTHLAQ